MIGTPLFEQFVTRDAKDRNFKMVQQGISTKQQISPDFIHWFTIQQISHPQENSLLSEISTQPLKFTKSNFR